MMFEVESCTVPEQGPDYACAKLRQVSTLKRTYLLCLLKIYNILLSRPIILNWPKIRPTSKLNKIKEDEVEITKMNLGSYISIFNPV